MDRARLTGPHQPQFAFNNQAKEHIVNRDIHTNRRHRGDARHGNIAGGLRRQQRHSSKGHVYFMNNKAEVVDQYKELASMYTKKTGVQVDIQTEAAGTSMPP